MQLLAHTVSGGSGEGSGNGSGSSIGSGTGGGCGVVVLVFVATRLNSERHRKIDGIRDGTEVRLLSEGEYEHRAVDDN